MNIRFLEKISFKILILSLSLFIFFLSLISLQKTKNQRTLIPENLDSFYLPSSKTLHYLAVGHDRSLSDLIWIKTLMYFGNELVGRKKQTWLYNYILTVIDLDPYFEKAYSWGGSAMLYNGAVITNESILKANEIYKKAIDKFPDNWKYPFSLGFNYVNEYHPASDQERKILQKKAIKLFIKASKLQGAPAYVRSMAVNQMDKEGMRLSAIEILKTSYASAKTAEEKKILEKKMKTLMKEDDILQFKQQKTLLEENYKKTFSYIPESLYFQIHKVLMINDKISLKALDVQK